ncbi:hypothetical protein TVAG_487530 [Trichomonas vaginalis G3]|uniref:Uncharacterized protein n=1 Tax=Trichomonas vaginalis (strain ATCC PRA-98 / G3) TaxID=412133 RepID=A2EFN2_TRIV3|nr:hypothetical protein TVAGG3_0062100 [Trichomonas vaginalis G3]EAY08527.1 hypothetical protein TVAG_487530 [Trichomonas vaginalis G3]KAI5542088.1 hypothetical protein TVAGG3_0062100 [Trichomonas vaginalis G3]|eukprot:XP_001320750.1 hypothetical protein [Trichomonas vaginalis G3]
MEKNASTPNQTKGNTSTDSSSVQNQNSKNDSQPASLNSFNSEQDTVDSFPFNPFSSTAINETPSPVQPQQDIPPIPKPQKLRVSIPYSVIVSPENVAPLHLQIDPADDSTTYTDMLELAESEAFTEGAFDFTELATQDDPMSSADAAFAFLKQINAQ